MTPSSTACVRPSPHVLFRDLQSEAVLLSLDDGRYFGLNDVGTRMWHALVTADSVAAARDVLLTEYDVDRNTLSQDLDRLLDQLIDLGLVHVLGDTPQATQS